MEFDVFGLHYNGSLYKTPSRKSFYFKEAHARNVITQDSKNIAYSEYWKETGKMFYELDKDEQQRRIEEVKQRFSIVPYVPVQFR